MKLVLFGPQGAGKGTQSARISEKYDIPSIATGDMFRWAIAHDTEVGHSAQQYVERGQFIPNDVTIEIVRSRLEAEDPEKGFLLEGFPRNLVQADALDQYLREKGLRLDAAVVMEVPEEVSLHRLLGRRVCSNCGRNYHVDSPPSHNWTCDRCGGLVEKRFDDGADETIKERLRLYHEQTEPLKAYYESRSMLRTIDGAGSQDEVFDRIVASL